MNLRKNKSNYSALAKTFHWGYVIFFAYGVAKQVDNLSQLEDSFFYDYMKKYPITKWGGSDNNKEHYQSNHDLNKLKILKKPIQQIEEILNNEVKKKILELIKK